MNVRRYEPIDHETLARWWTKWKWPTIPQESLPPLGIMVDECACGFIYRSEANLAWVEWIVADPEASKERRANALKRLMEELEAECKRGGYRMMFTMTKNASLIKKFKDFGFQVADQGMTNLIKVI